MRKFESVKLPRSHMDHDMKKLWRKHPTVCYWHNFQNRYSCVSLHLFWELHEKLLMVTNWDRPDSLNKLSKLLYNHLYGAQTKSHKKQALEVQLGVW